MRELDLIIFDMDGLMFDTERMAFASWQEAAVRQGYRMDRETYLKIVGVNIRKSKEILLTHFGQDFPVDRIRDEGFKITDGIIRLKGVPIKDGLHELLGYLAKSGIKKAVATSTSRERALALLKMAGIETCFDYVLCGDEIENSKPHPEIFLKVAAKLGCLPERCLVLEDSEMGILAAYEAGIPSILVPDMKEPSAEIRALPLKQMASLHDVRSFLEAASLR